METLLSLCLGLGLAAACGFRIFVPYLLISIAARAGYVPLGADFDWIASTPALLTFAVATVLEVGAYYIPGLDNLLDVVATPAAVVAGAVATASVVIGMDPWLKWTVAAIAGGAIAGAVQSSTVGLRAASMLGTGGIANPAVSTAEAAGSLVMTLVSLLMPLLAVALIVLGLWLVLRLRRARRQQPAA